MRQRLRPLKYTPAEQEAGAAMEGAYRSLILALGPAAAEQAVARQAMLAAARANARVAGHAAEFAAAQEVALGSAAEQGAVSAEQSGPRFASLLDRLPACLNPLNYETCGLGSNFGNLRFKPRPDSRSSRLAQTTKSAIEHDAPVLISRTGSPALADVTSFDGVAAHVVKTGKLPNNFISKAEAKALGWNPKAGNLADVAPGKSIGGDIFGNAEGLLPNAPGRTWFEADINYSSGSRGADRLLYSSDGLIFKTTDHYKTFTQIK